jgi:hypothetical protein
VYFYDGPAGLKAEVVSQPAGCCSAFCPILDGDDTLRGGTPISAVPRVCPMTHLAWWPYIVLAGAGVGICTGLFGVGGSSVATPVLALLGAPGLIAVASPLPATIPSAAVGVVPYVRSGEARTHAAAWSVLGGVPARSPERCCRGWPAARCC